MLFSGYECDKCGVQVVYGGYKLSPPATKVHLIRFARRDGWSVGKEKILCPNCRRKGRK